MSGQSESRTERGGSGWANGNRRLWKVLRDLGRGKEEPKILLNFMSTICWPLSYLSFFLSVCDVIPSLILSLCPSHVSVRYNTD
jgi:hypothetical protein